VDGNPSLEPPDLDAVLERLNRSLSSHLERLTGASHGINGLPLDVVSVACLVLLVEQSSGSGRMLDRGLILSELREMGLDAPELLDRTLVRMAESGYLEETPNRGIFAGKPAVSMARLLDHAFPGMPGMNLVAYIAQTLDEALSGRKGLEEAADQLEQMFKRHGVELRRSARPERAPSQPPPQSKTRKPRSGGTPSRNRGLTPTPRPVLGAELKEFLARQAAEEKPGPQAPVIEEEPPRVPEEATSPIDLEVEETLTPGEHPSPPDEEFEEAGSMPEEQDLAEGLHEEAAPPENEPEQEEYLPAEATPKDEPSPHEPLGSEMTDRSEDRETQQEDVPLDDSTIDTVVEQKVAALEEQLALECPLCHKSFVEARQTATGRVYYMCPDKECMFISWGRPHHLTCPRCGNPFLVEAGSGEGDSYLKCPRATCGYRLPITGEDAAQGPREARPSPPPLSLKKPKRRVVKRRVVRKRR
jgi:hypothetical protein